MSDAPQRRVEVRISLGADSQEDAIRALRTILDDAERAERLPQHQISGGYNSGWVIASHEDGAQTHASWFNQVSEWIAARRREDAANAAS